MPYKDPKKIREARRRWRKENREKYRAVQNRSRKRHPETRRRAARLYYAADPQKKCALVRKWQKANPLLVGQIQANRRALIRGSNGKHTLAEWRECKERYDHTCVYCGRTDRPLTRDHVLPVTKGGSNAIGNIVPACRPCNSRKGNR